MSLVNAFVQELENEAATTRRVLERVPADKLAWRPHPKSMTLGQLALHVAGAPGVTCSWAVPDVFEFTGGGEGAPQPSSTAEILDAHEKSVASTKESLAKIGDAGLHAPWKATAGSQTLFAMPKVAFVRAVVMNHWIHHRGQLSVYLRLLDVPVPSIYGPSADENPFAART
ncbi:MAG: DinB family protein [Acidobacteria bacterium]|nr:DinB family protein [Acidobacteriota bacterium]